MIYDKTIGNWRRAKDNESSDTWCRTLRNDVSKKEVEIVDNYNGGEGDEIVSTENYIQYYELSYKWENSGNEDNAVPFDYTKEITLIDTEEEKYEWSGIGIKNEKLYYSDVDTNFVNFGNFGVHQGLNYKDHF